MTKYYITLSKSFRIETKGTEEDAINKAIGDLIEGLSTGEITKNQFEVDCWEEK